MKVRITKVTDRYGEVNKDISYDGVYDFMKNEIASFCRIDQPHTRIETGLVVNTIIIENEITLQCVNDVYYLKVVGL